MNLATAHKRNIIFLCSLTQLMKSFHIGWYEIQNFRSFFLLIYVLFNQRGDITTCFTRFHSIFGRLDLTFLEMYQSSRTLYFLDEFLILLSKFQEFCLDLYQPSGMGRRRKRTRKSRSADDEGHLGFFYPVTPSTKQRRNNSRILNDPKENFGTATNINDNVGVTVIMPPGKQKS